MTDHTIRPITVAEQATRAARRAAETGVEESNPHPDGTGDHDRWKATYLRQLLWFSSEESSA